MVYSVNPPYEILQNKSIDFASMQQLRRFARYWDLIGNSGNFISGTPLLWSDGGSPFDRFMQFSRWLHKRVGRTDSIALTRLMELLFEFLTAELGLACERVAGSLWSDYQRGGRRDKPSFLADALPSSATRPAATRSRQSLPKRQARHAVPQDS